MAWAKPHASARILTPLLVVAALTGTWVGHTLEMFVEEQSFRSSLDSLHLAPAVTQVLLQRVAATPFAGVHRYMLGLGLALTIISFLGAAHLWNAWRSFNLRLDQVRLLVLSTLRNHPVPAAPRIDPSSTPPSFISMWTGLALAQIVLYLVQENTEAILTRSRPPGFGVLTGTHWSAALIQCGVALLLSGAMLLLTRLFRRKVHELVRAARFANAIWTHAFRASQSCSQFRRADSVPPLMQLLGCDLWQRPPPQQVLI